MPQVRGVPLRKVLGGKVQALTTALVVPYRRNIEPSVLDSPTRDDSGQAKSPLPATPDDRGAIAREILLGDVGFYSRGCELGYALLHAYGAVFDIPISWPLRHR